METLYWILLSTIFVSLIAIIGIITFMFNEKTFKKLLLFLVALAAGALMGGAFIHLIPEAVEEFNTNNIFTFVLVGFILFFLIEKVLHWHHCHTGKKHVHTFAYMNIVGECLHNFIDGLIIAAAFVTNINLGIVTTIAVALHEIPQEIGDFGVLVYGGFKKAKALLLNFFCALTAVLGGLIGYFLSKFAESSITFLIPFAAGGFIYIAASDLIPEIRKEPKLKKSLQTFAVFILGILIMYSIKFIKI